jgi:hypothetical protein
MPYYLPPRCPHCHEPLDKVYEYGIENYTFNPQTGAYDHDGLTDWMDVKCSNCECKVNDVIEDGPCNFQSEDQAPCPPIPTTS